MSPGPAQSCSSCVPNPSPVRRHEGLPPTGELVPDGRPLPGAFRNAGILPTEWVDRTPSRTPRQAFVDRWSPAAKARITCTRRRFDGRLPAADDDAPGTGIPVAERPRLLRAAACRPGQDA